MAHFDEDRYSLAEARRAARAATTPGPRTRRRGRGASSPTCGSRPIAGSHDVEARSYLLLYRSRGDDRAADVLSAERTDRLRRCRAAGSSWRATSSSTRRCCATQNLAAVPLTMAGLGPSPGRSSCAPAAARASGGPPSTPSSPPAPASPCLELRSRPSATSSTPALGDAVHRRGRRRHHRAGNEQLVAAALDRWGRVDAAVTFVGVFDLYTPAGRHPRRPLRRRLRRDLRPQRPQPAPHRPRRPAGAASAARGSIDLHPVQLQLLRRAGRRPVRQLEVRAARARSPSWPGRWPPRSG